MSGSGHATSMCAHLEAGGLFDLFLRSRRHAVLVDRGGGGFRHLGTNWWVLVVDELDEPVSSCQTWGLRKKSVCAQQALILIAGKTPLRCVLRLHDCRAVVRWPSFTQDQLQRALLHNHDCTLTV